MADDGWSQAMEAAIEQARLALDHDDVPVGAVIVRDGAVIAAASQRARAHR